MTNTAKAIYSFFSGFGLPAYAESNVPDEATLPYITYQQINPSWSSGAPFYARVWYRSESFVDINATVDAIEDAIGEGISLTTQTGAVYINKGDPFCQYQDMAGDTTLKCAYLSMIIQAHTT